MSGTRTMITTGEMLASLAEHLTGFELADPVQVTAAVDGGNSAGTIQLSGGSLPELAAELLTWADTLDAVTACAWRPSCPDEDLVVLEVRGRLTDDVPVRVFGGLVDGPRLPGLVAGRRVALSWALLRSWALLADGRTA
ncbi:hypothetical protein [Actinocrispum wychmicini]|uniref:Uncharacterized protein n=1 Tax=Actinocrispum wychmicini TaxID=1213861 RepID=A0A4R2JLH5_9PSEU|nr:hypothetical protein [Actinocrispum wychmicini]TCO59442.1 hypothetical protein EV192_104284 [Actinocrispum wychmicini]